MKIGKLIQNIKILILSITKVFIETILTFLEKNSSSNYFYANFINFFNLSIVNINVFFNFNDKTF
jgi:hypothetical protein